MELLPPLPLFGAFLVTSLVLAVTPGPGVFYIVARSLSQGRLSGLASVAGVALGNLGNALGSALGLAALFAISTLAYTLVKYLGAAYLVYLGVKHIYAAKRKKDVSPEALPSAAPSRIFIDGFVVALLNPKTALFFAAFLPQFIHSEGSMLIQSIVLAGIFVLIAAITDTLYALLASAFGPFLSKRQGAGTIGRYAAGGAFIGLGLYTALSGQRPVGSK